MTRHRACALLVVGWPLTAAGCRQLDVCGGDERPPCPEVASANPPAAAGTGPQAEAGSGGVGDAPGGAGAGAAGGVAPDESCEPARADCDESPLTVCEANLARDPKHCGACDRKCTAGVCIDSRCSPFEVVADDLYTPEPAIGVTRDYVFFATRDRVGGMNEPDLVRFDRRTRGAQVVVYATFGDVIQLLPHGERLYVLARSGVWSLTLSGEDLRQETIEAEALAGRGGHLYFAQYGQLRRRVIGSTQDEIVAEFPSPSLKIASDGHALLVGNMDLVDDRLEYEVHASAAEGEDWVTTLRGEGSLRSVFLNDRSPYALAERRPEVLEVVGPERLAISLQTPEDDHEVREVSVGESFVVSTWQRGAHHGLQLTALDEASRTVQLETIGELRHLHHAEGRFWFFDLSAHALMQVAAAPLYLAARE